MVRRYTRQLVEATACLHEHGVVHRDIKTANIFLTEEMKTIKLGDFGCAVAVRTSVPADQPATPSGRSPVTAATITWSTRQPRKLCQPRGVQHREQLRVRPAGGSPLQPGQAGRTP